MRYLLLSSSSKHFDYTANNNKIELTWNLPFDFTNIGYVGISNLHIGNLIASPTDAIASVHSNIISRTMTNPDRNILNFKIPKDSTVVEVRLNMGKLNKVNTPV